MTTELVRMGLAYLTEGIYASNQSPGPCLGVRTRCAAENGDTLETTITAGGQRNGTKKAAGGSSTFSPKTDSARTIRFFFQLFSWAPRQTRLSPPKTSHYLLPSTRTYFDNIPSDTTVKPGTRGRGYISLHGGPTRRGERVYTYRADQSDEGRGYIPTGRTNQMRGEGIYLQGGPIR
eukprot:1179407-Prorocentrum_minimum.AAC.3